MLENRSVGAEEPGEASWRRCSLGLGAGKREGELHGEDQGGKRKALKAFPDPHHLLLHVLVQPFTDIYILFLIPTVGLP